MKKLRISEINGLVVNFPNALGKVLSVAALGAMAKHESHWQNCRTVTLPYADSRGRRAFIRTLQGGHND